MYEVGRRALHAQAALPQRINFNGSRLPDSREDFNQQLPLSALPDDISEVPATWFRIQSSYSYQRPSCILVEKAIPRNDVVDVKSSAESSSRTLDSGTTLSGTKGSKSKIARGKKVKSNAKFLKKKRTKLTLNPNKDPNKESESRGAALANMGEADSGGPSTIGEGLPINRARPSNPAAMSLTVIRTLELGVGDFFSFLFSDRWSDGRLLRVMRGRLLIQILDTINQLLKQHRIFSYSTMAYMNLRSPLKSCNRNPDAKWVPDEVEKNVLVELDYYIPYHQPAVAFEQNKLESPISLSSQLVETDPFWFVSSSSSLIMDFPGATVSSSQCFELPMHAGLAETVVDPLSALAGSSDAAADPLKTVDVAAPLSQNISFSNVNSAPQASSALTVPGSSSPGLSLSEASTISNSKSESPQIMSPFGSTDSLEVLTSKSLKSDPSSVPYHNDNVTGGSHSIADSVQCNIRGQLRPLPHNDCSSDFHAIHETFQPRRRREQTGFPPHTLPEEKQKMRASLPGDDDNELLGPKFEDDTEPVMSDVCLPLVPKQSTGQINQKKCFKQKLQPRKKTLTEKKEKKTKKTISTENSDSMDDQNYDQEEIQLKSSIDPSRAEQLKKDIEQMNTELVVKKMPKKGGENTQIKLKRQLKKKQVSRSLKEEKPKSAATKKPADRKTKQVKGGEAAKPQAVKPSKPLAVKSSKSQAAKPRAVEPSKLQAAKPQAVKSSQPQVAKPQAVEPSKPPVKPSKPQAAKPQAVEPPESLIPQVSPAQEPQFMQEWSHCPTFSEFLSVLELEKVHKKQKKVKGIKSASSRSKISACNISQASNFKEMKTPTTQGITPSDQAEKSQPKKLSTSENRQQKKRPISENRQQEPNRRISETGPEKKNPSKPNRDVITKNGSCKQEQKGKKGKKKTGTCAASGLNASTKSKLADKIYIDDSEIPDSISEEELLSIMQVGKLFDPHKLKSSYSFEKMFAHRADQIPNYTWKLNIFQKPFKKPASKVKQNSPRTKSNSKKRKSTGVADKNLLKSGEKSKPLEISNEHSPQSAVSEPLSPPVILGKLKEYEFLRHRDQNQEQVRSPNPEPPVLDSDVDISQLLILAMQKYVMRKERATPYNHYQSQGKVSITFSKRSESDVWLGVPVVVMDSLNAQQNPCASLAACTRLADNPRM